jgi:hypothetical protein
VAYGTVINAIINFLVVAFALFLVIKATNTVRRPQPAAPAAPSKEEVLLTFVTCCRADEVLSAGGSIRPNGKSPELALAPATGTDVALG